MFRVQFYPSEELTKVLGERANKAGVSVNKQCDDFLQCNYWRKLRQMYQLHN